MLSSSSVCQTCYRSLFRRENCSLVQLSLSPLLLSECIQLHLTPGSLAGKTASQVNTCFCQVPRFLVTNLSLDSSFSSVAFLPHQNSLLCPWDFLGKNTGVGCHALLQGIFPTQGSNLHLLRWQVGSLRLSHLGTITPLDSK